MMTASASDIARQLPKVLLHEHLDGGLCPATLIELARTHGVALPADEPAALAAWFRSRAMSGSLPAFLEGFELTIAAMASVEALERVAFEAAEDAIADGIVLAEFRCAPALWEGAGVPADAAIAAMLAGLRRSRLASGLIVCALRQFDAGESARIAELAVRHAGGGVIGFDLAGPEAGFPPALHARALAIAHEAVLPITCHAGEADAAARVLEAARLGAVRIGHGVRLADALGTPLADEAIARGLHLEICPTSNVCTGAAASIATHPIRALRDAGLSLSFHTDSRLITGVSQSDEALALVTHAGFSWDDLAHMGLQAAAASFLPEPDRQRAAAAINAWRADQAAAASGKSSASTP